MKRLFVIAALATFATAAQAQTPAATTSTAAPTTTAAIGNPPVSGEVAAPLPDPEAAATANKPYSISYMSQITAGANQLNYGSSGTTFKTVNYLGGTYKIDKDDRISLRQYFTYNRVPGADNKAVLNDQTLIWTRSFGGVAKSDPVTGYFWYYVPTSEASRALSSNGKLRADVEWDWTLNPKWTVGYFMNPRQSFVPRQLVANPNKEAAETEPFVEASSMTTLIHSANLYYTLNDKVTFYTTVGYTHIWRTRDAILSDQTFDIALAGMFTLGKFQLVAEVDNNVTQRENFQKTDGKFAVNEDTLTYALQGAVSF